MKMYCYRSKDSIEKPEDSSEVIDPEPSGKSGECKLCQTWLRKWYEITIKHFTTVVFYNTKHNNQSSGPLRIEREGEGKCLFACELVF